MKLRTSVLIGIFLGHSLGWLLLDPIVSAAASPSQVLISELQTNGGTGHAGNEFIELYNPSSDDIALDGWKVQYHSSSNTDCVNGWSSSPKIIVTTPAVIKSHGFYLFAATGYLTTADSRFSAGLSDSAGAIRLLRPDMSVADALAWGAAPCGMGTAAPSPTIGRSLERRPGEDAPLAGNSSNTSDNAQDFSLRTMPEPQSTLSAIEDPSLFEEVPALSTPVYLPLKVTELLIDPVSPATDSHDEFIELQNPNTEAVNIDGYILKTPSSSFHLAPLILTPGQFIVITSGASTLSLTNDGGNIQAFDPAGTLVDESAPWPKAIPGATWASFSDGWAWTLHPTPNTDNIYEEIPTPSMLPSNDNATSEPNGITPVYLPLQITELYIDPISPQTDDQNEYVELYNPNDEPVDTSGYRLKSGSNLGNSTTLDHHILEAHQYLALYSSETNLPLSNSGSTIQLYDPAGAVIGRPITYSTAKTGQVWALIGDATWQWSTTSTPNAENILTLPIVAVKTPAASKASVIAKSKATPKPKVTKPKKSTAPKTKVVKTTKTAKTSTPVTAALHKNSGHTLILILLGLTICYVIYEFRYDIRHHYHRFRGHTKSRA
ncbi:MAG: lamin tail domain-containing protein [Candidatus Saccharibacteria bacterium]